jgi:type IV secretion system protein VirB6
MSLNLLTDLVGGLFIPSMNASTGLGDFAYYVVIYKFAQGEIQDLGPAIMGRFMEMAMMLVLVLMTIWVFWQGLRIFTGQGRESMMDFVMKAARNGFIVACATTMTLAGGGSLHRFLTEGIDRAAVVLLTGKDMRSSDLTELALGATQIALSSIDAVEIGNEGNIRLADQKERTMWIAGFGALGPAVTGGGMLLLYQMAIALFIGFGPLFILCLMFEQTKQMFWKWLYYGLATTFSMATLTAMSILALKITMVVVLSFWMTAGVGAAAGTNLTQGMSAMALQQGGIGLLLTVLLISVPPMAGSFFSMALGNFFSQSQFGQGGGAAAAQQQQAAANAARYSQQPSAKVSNDSGGQDLLKPDNMQATRTTHAGSQNQNIDGIKSSSERGLAADHKTASQPPRPVESQQGHGHPNVSNTGKRSPDRGGV